MENRRIIFMGTPKIASVVLKTMLENGETSVDEVIRIGIK